MLEILAVGGVITYLAKDRIKSVLSEVFQDNEPNTKGANRNMEDFYELDELRELKSVREDDLLDCIGDEDYDKAEEVLEDLKWLRDKIAEEEKKQQKSSVKDKVKDILGSVAEKTGSIVGSFVSGFKKGSQG
jgi:hypothetical protein